MKIVMIQKSQFLILLGIHGAISHLNNELEISKLQSVFIMLFFNGIDQNYVLNGPR